MLGTREYCASTKIYRQVYDMHIMKFLKKTRFYGERPLRDA